MNKYPSIGGGKMNRVLSSEELMKDIHNMDSENSVIQFSVPRKGRFTLVLQEEDDQTIEADVKENPKLEVMLKEVQKNTRTDMKLLLQTF